MKDFITSQGDIIPAKAMRRALERIDEDWQLVMTEEFRDYIPASEDDDQIAMEAIREVEEIAGQYFR
jgi:hypothetical protein